MSENSPFQLSISAADVISSFVCVVGVCAVSGLWIGENTVG